MPERIAAQGYLDPVEVAALTKRYATPDFDVNVPLHGDLQSRRGIQPAFDAGVDVRRALRAKACVAAAADDLRPARTRGTMMQSGVEE
jgi:hypothetical protein